MTWWTQGKIWNSSLRSAFTGIGQQYLVWYRLTRLSEWHFGFHRMLSEFVWDASVLEGNLFTFPEVQTLLDGVIIGGRQYSDQTRVVHLAESCKHLFAQLKAGKLSLDKATFTQLHSLVARNEALERGALPRRR